MSKSRHNISTRISEVRALANLSQSQLAQKLGVSTSLISHWEKGTRTPSQAQLVAIAQHLGVALDYLLNAAVRPEFKFRARATSPQQQAIEHTLIDASAQVHFVDTAFQLAKTAPKPFSLRADFDSFEDLPNVASSLRETLKLNRRVTLDELKQALSEWNIFVFEWAMPWHLSGLSFRGPFTVIFINHVHSAARRLFTLAHEFAHVVFHLGREAHPSAKKGHGVEKRMDTVISISSHRDPLEKQANAFAGEFLMPRADLEKFVEKYGSRLKTPAGLESLAQHFNVSRDAIFYRLTQLDVFRWSEKSSYFMGKFTPPPPPAHRVEKIREQVDVGFRELALTLHQSETISTGKLAEWFFAPRHVVEDYIAELSSEKEIGISEDPNQEGEIAEEV